MTEHEHLQDLADEFNARARAEGRYLDKDFWEIPSRPGSILDIPETDKSREDLAWFRERRRRRSEAVRELPETIRQNQDEVREAVREQIQADSPGK